MTRSVWIRGFDGRYKIHDDGNVESFYRGKPQFIKGISRPNGYLQVVLRGIDGRIKTEAIHRLVAQHFVPGRKAGLQVNHKNGIKTDNRAENLEWLSQQENIKHAFTNGLRRSAKPVIGVQIKTGRVIKFQSSSAAASQVNGVKSHIYDCCLGKRLTHKGYRWSYA